MKLRDHFEESVDGETPQVIKYVCDAQANAMRKLKFVWKKDGVVLDANSVDVTVLHNELRIVKKGGNEYVMCFFFSNAQYYSVNLLDADQLNR